MPTAFERAVALHRSRIALGASAWQPTYDELNASANRLAHALLRQRGARGDRVAVLMQHDTPLIGAILSVLKAGRIVVTLNPTHPPARLEQLIQDAEPTFIVTDTIHLHLAAKIAPATCAIIQFERATAEGAIYNPSLTIGADETAFIVYTSGSTGRPKGVMQTHRFLLRNAGIHTDAMEYSAHDRIPLLGFLSGGQAVNMMWCALLNGATLCPVSLAVKGTAQLGAWMIDQGITVYVSSASIFRRFMNALEDDIKFPLVHAVRLSSEAATSSDFRFFQRHFSHQCRFVHTLSSSETANIAVYRRSRSDEVPDGRLPIGTLSRGIELLFLDECGRPVGPGDVGEIVIKSRYLAAGYWRQPALTAKRFSGKIGGVREFRTGDLGRINSAGLLEYVGRTDSRVKILGNRVELPEVESALERLPGVEGAVVESLERDNHEPALIGHVVVKSGHSWSALSLRNALRKLVPDHMVPAAFVLLDSFPLTSSGKIDREKLRQAYQPAVSQGFTEQSATRIRVETKIQQTLLALWRDVLKDQNIGCGDDFFLCGGDSLSAVDLLQRIEEELQYQLPLTVLMEAPTVNQLDARFEKATLGAINNTIRLNIAGTKRPLFAVSGRYGHVLRMLPSLRSLGPDQPCYGLQPPGMDWGTKGCTTVQEMATHYIGEIKTVQPRGPYRLLGASFGGLIVFEIALQLQRMGESVEFLAMLDSSPPTCVVDGVIDVSQPRLIDDGPPQRADSIEATNIRVAQSHLNARRQYFLDNRLARNLFLGELTYFYCAANVIVAGHERRRLWQHFAHAGFRLLPIPGQHGAFHEEPQATALQNLLRACLDGEPPTASDPASVFDQTFRIEKRKQRECIVSSMGDVYRIEPDRVQGYVDWVKADADVIHILGWAVESCQRQPAQIIGVFLDDRFLGYGASGVSRPDVAKQLATPLVQVAGFDFYLRCGAAAGAVGRARLFVLSGDGGAAELRFSNLLSPAEEVTQ